MNEVSTILTAIESGDQAAASKLLPLVYDELRRLAAQRLAKEKPGGSVQPTLLVHDAYLRLVDGDPKRQWNGKSHFFGAAAEAMRRIMIEHARRKRSEKHGGKMQRIGVEFLPPEDTPDKTDLLALDEVLTKFEQKWPEKAQLVKLRFFVGMSVKEAAGSLGISLTSAERSWVFARAWLHSRLNEQ
jgi:RNA polymerase sigma factor (TIGR02999 family)